MADKLNWGWYVTYVAVFVTNNILIREVAHLSFSDTITWVWFSLPILAVFAGRYTYRKESED